MPDDSIDFEFESEKLLRGIEAELTQVELNYQQEQVQLKAIEDEERELRKQLQKLAERKREYETAVWDTRKKIRQIKDYDLAEAQQKLEIEKKNKEVALRRAETDKEFDEVISRAAWADRALPHQLEGAKFLATAKRAICADSMGTGKTFQSVMYLDLIKSRRALVVCPGDVMTNFEQETKKWSDRRTVVIGKETKAKQKAMLDIAMMFDDKPFTIIVNYQTWSKSQDIINWMIDVGFDTVIIDEAHNIKETSGLFYKGIRRIVQALNRCSQCNNITVNTDWDRKTGSPICPKCGSHGMVPSVENYLSMTGSPILNKPSEIFASLHLVDNTLFPDHASFRRAFTEINRNTGKEEWAVGGEKQLAQRISGMYIRRTLKDAGIELPPQDIIFHEIDIPEEEYALQYEILKMLREDATVRTQDGKAATAASILSLITRQRQATVWPGGIWMDVPKRNEYTGLFQIDAATGDFITERIHVGKDFQQSAKLDAAVDIYQELVDDGHRVVFFSQFKEALKELKKRLGSEVAEFHGDVRDTEREAIKRNFDRTFNESAKWKGVLAHYGVGGVGVNFTEATAMIILDREWNPGKESQAMDRIHRIGQTEKTQIHILEHSGPQASIDKWLSDIIKLKKNIVGGFEMTMDVLKSAFE